MGVSRNEDKVSFIKSDSLQQQPKRNLKLDLVRPNGNDGDEGTDDDVDDSNSHLLSAKNLYIDSPRVGQIDEDLTDDEITRRKRVGMATVLGLFMSVMLCVLFMKYLSEHESFRFVPSSSSCGGN